MAALPEILTVPKRRLLAIALLALALSPGLFLRAEVREVRDDRLTFTAVTSVLPRENRSWAREGLWELDSRHSDFGGYSALLLLGGDVLRAFSDRGARVTFTMPEADEELQEARFSRQWNRGPLSLSYPDLESATRDPEGGDYWIAFEATHAVLRYDFRSNFEAARLPREWQGWPANAGAEAMTRLADGRFIVLPERDSYGFLYDGDPTQDVRIQRFRFAIPDGYHPTDMATLPDGRVLVLERKIDWALPPFSARLGIANPAEISAEGIWSIETLLELNAILPRENFEGLAVDPQEDGAVVVWLVSDDNNAAMQRTLLAKLVWDPETEKGARNEPDAPENSSNEKD